MKLWLRIACGFVMTVVFAHMPVGAVHGQTRSEALWTAVNNQPDTPGWANTISGGQRHTCALTIGGGARCWGSNQGPLGDGTSYARVTATDVIGLSAAFAAVSAGGWHTCGVDVNGGAACWGDNTYGQLGDGTNTDRLTPTYVVGLTQRVRAITAGDMHTCALLETGGVKCWGRNNDGELGDGTTTMRLTPVSVSDMESGIRAVAAGSAFTCAVTENGTAKCWGQNGVGQLGNGSTAPSTIPVNVVGIEEGIRSIHPGYLRTCALTASGGVKCWGYNLYGVLGDGTQTPRLTPVSVVGLEQGVQAISLGAYHSCAVTDAGAAKCWGYNKSGQLGDGTSITQMTPVDVSNLGKEVRAITTGGWHSCAVTVNGVARCWGLNSNGQLGDGTTVDRLTPTDVVLQLPYDCAPVTEIAQAECRALADLYRATNGPVWRNHAGWLETTTPCSWYGVTCEAGHVSQLSLPYNNLVDGLPTDLGDLAALQWLDLRGNLLGGALPADLGNLTALVELNLSSNQLAGPLPLTLTNLRTLQMLDLHANRFSGELSGLDNLPGLQYLDLSSNAFSGPIPVALGNLSALQHLDLSHNQLADSTDGIFVGALAKLKRIRYLDLSYNQLYGPLPWWPDWAELEHLDLSHNAFEGGLPWQFTGLTRLQYLALHSNQLTGLIPAAWGSIGAAVVPPAVGAAPPEGIYIDLSGNHLYGTIPVELGQNPAIVGLQLSGNQLSGVVSNSFFARQFYCLDLNHNQLTPSDPCDMDWCATQTLPPTKLRATMTEAGLVLTWANIAYPGYDGGYEISYAAAPHGPFTIATYLPDTRWGTYTITGVAPEATHCVRLRTVTHARAYSASDACLSVFNHAYFQPNNLWSDYTPVVCVGDPQPVAHNVWLPLVAR